MSTKSKKPNRSRTKGRCRKMMSNLLISVLVHLRFVYDWFIDFIFSKIYDDTKKIKLPFIENSIIMESATSLADKIRNRQISSEAVVRAFIDQIKVVNPLLNCVVDDRFNLAIEEACEVDKYLFSTKLSAEELKTQKPFLGVPFTSKESTAAKGMSFTIGLLSRRETKATEDAAIVALAKESGAILVGVTNIPELNLWCETRNNIFGQTNNPYNANRTVGGSSGGEACLLAVAGTPLSLGTDIGGSARMPAYYCGVFGHKPTTGLTSSRGMSFRNGTEKDTMVAGGPMTKYAIDIIPWLRVMLGGKTSFLKLDFEVDLKKLNVIFIEEPGDSLVSPVSDDVKRTIRRAVNHLSFVTGHPARKVIFSGFKFSYKLWKHEMTKEPGNFAYDMSNQEKEVSLWTEIPLLLTGCTKFTLPPLMRLFDMKVLPSVKEQWAEETIMKLKNELLEELGENGVLLFPSCPTTAPHHYASFFRPYNFTYWAIFNVLRLPVTQVPMGLDKNNLPLGIQVVAAPYKDHLCIAVAKELEKTFGGWVSPFSIESK